MAEAGWTSEESERRLPRLDELPTAPEGYDPQAVREAFDAFYRHAAELDSTLRTLEAVDAFQRQAAELRADIRSLRAASWAPGGSTVRGEPWYVGQRRRARTGAAGVVSDAFPRVVVETAFILVVAVGAAVAGLSTPLVVALVAAAWAIVGAAEVVASVAGPRLRRRRAVPFAPASAEPAPTVVAAPLPADTPERPPAEAPAPAAAAAEPEPAFPPEAEVAEHEPPADELEPVEEEAAVVEAEPEREPEPAAELEPSAPAAVAEDPAAEEEELPAAEAEDTGEVDVVEPVPMDDVAADAEAPVHAAVTVDPWEAGPELPGGDAVSDVAQFERSRFRFWRRRRSSPEEQALVPEPTGHVNVISVRPAPQPEDVEAPWDAPPVETVLEGVEATEGWKPPAGYERGSAPLRRGRR